MSGIPIARVRAEDRTLTVVRWPYGVSIHDHPEPGGHAGYSMGLAEAKLLGEAMVAGCDCRLSTYEGAVLVAQPTVIDRPIAAERGVSLGRLSHPHSAWLLTKSAGRQLGQALVKAVSEDGASAPDEQADPLPTDLGAVGMQLGTLDQRRWAPNQRVRRDG